MPGSISGSHTTHLIIACTVSSQAPFMTGYVFTYRTHENTHNTYTTRQNTTLFLVSMNMQTQQMKFYAIQDVDPNLSQAYVSDSIEVTSDGRGIWIMVSFDSGIPPRNDKDGKERGTLASYVTQFFKLDLQTYNVTATSVPFYGYACTGLTHTKTQCLNSFATVYISISKD